MQESETDRHRIEARPRDATAREWEVFVRSSTDEPLRHVGSVSAPTAGVAREQADRLFDAVDVWLCPAEAVARFVADGVEVDGTASEGPVTGETADAAGGDGE